MRKIFTTSYTVRCDIYVQNTLTQGATSYPGHPHPPIGQTARRRLVRAVLHMWRPEEAPAT